MKRYLPSFFTLLNLVIGSIGVITVLRGNLVSGVLCIGVGVFFDFMDGFLARLFRFSASFGSQLDSLSDLITFGLLPSTIMYSLIELQTSSPYLPYVALLIIIFSALRLAKFNTDSRQETVFIGLPTPANAIFISTLPLLLAADNHFWFLDWLVQPTMLTVICIVSSWLLVANISFIALKFDTYAWYPNRAKYIFLIAVAPLIVFFRTEGIILSFLLYILLSSLLQHSLT